MPPRPDALRFLAPAWFALPMGLAGLALAWQRAVPLMGEVAGLFAAGLAVLAAVALLMLLLASLQRWRRWPEAWAEDLKHPMRHASIAGLPIATVLLATLAAQLLGPGAPAAALWWIGGLAQLAVSTWVLARFWRGATGAPPAGAQAWAGITPLLLMPVVGHVAAPLAGVALGEPEWAAAQLGIGLLFWPVVVGLLLMRVTSHGMFAERLLPTAFILVSPPALVGLSLLELGAPRLVGWAAWGMALFCLLWALALMRRIRGLAFSVSHWSLGFPLAAFSALTLRLAQPGSALAVAGPAALALCSIVVLGLLLATWRGLRDGTLLAPEPLAMLVSAPSR